jgi:hypothetical protein
MSAVEHIRDRDFLQRRAIKEANPTASGRDERSARRTEAEETPQVHRPNSGCGHVNSRNGSGAEGGRETEAEGGEETLTFLVRVGWVARVVEFTQVVRHLSVDTLRFLDQSLQRMGLFLKDLGVRWFFSRHCPISTRN